MIVPGRVQNSPLGSYARFPLGDKLAAEMLSLHRSIWSTLPVKGKQTVWTIDHASGTLTLELENALPQAPPFKPKS